MARKTMNQLEARVRHLEVALIGLIVVVASIFLWNTPMQKVLDIRSAASSFFLLATGLVVYVVSAWTSSRTVRMGAYAVWGLAFVFASYNILCTGYPPSIVFNVINGLTLSMLAVWSVALILVCRSTHYSYVGYDDRSILIRVIMITLFVWLNSPLWSYSSLYISALALYISGLFALGIYTTTFVYRMYAYMFSVAVIGYVAQKYLLTRWVHPHHALQLTFVFGLLTFLLFAIRAVFHNRRAQLTAFERDKVEPLLHLLITIVILAWGRAMIIIRFDESHMPGSFFMQRFGGYTHNDTILLRTATTDIILRLYYAIFAAISLAVGIIKKERGFIYLAMLLVVLVLYKIWCMLLGVSGIVHETVAAVVIGGIVVAGTHFVARLR